MTRGDLAKVAKELGTGRKPLEVHVISGAKAKAKQVLTAATAPGHKYGTCPDANSGVGACYSKARFANDSDTITFSMREYDSVPLARERGSTARASDVVHVPQIMGARPFFAVLILLKMELSAFRQ